MTALNVAHQRLRNQRLAGTPFEDPVEVVRWLGAVQSQDYPAAKWAVSQRTTGATDAAIEQALIDGKILRTHVLRPTWHFVLPADIRWMQALTAPRVKVTMASTNRKLELDEKLFARSNDILAKTLQGGKHLTRTELASALQQAGVETADLLRLTHLMMHAELDAVICNGAKRGKQFTYALLDERAPQTKTLERDEALAELARRYFTSHGPATLKDYVWWSGLTVADAKAGLEMNKSQMIEEVIDGTSYWLSPSVIQPRDSAATAYLLPNYDEYMVAYADRSASIDSEQVNTLDPRGNILFSSTIVVDGKVIGAWKRTFAKGAAVIIPTFLAPLTVDERQALNDAANRYAEFLGMPVFLS